MIHAKNYLNWPMFHGVIQKNNTGTVFLRHGVYTCILGSILCFRFVVSFLWVNVFYLCLSISINFDAEFLLNVD